jgi:hypothetical protein
MIDHAEVRRLADVEDMSPKAIAKQLNCSAGYVRLIIRGEIEKGEGRLSRKVPKSLRGKSTVGMPAFDSPAIVGGRTIYAGTVASAADPERTVVKSAYNSAKIGNEVQKGKWRGFSIFTVTLEERATCPTYCKHWRSCFGNNMHQAERFIHGGALERRIAAEVAALGRKHPNGFAVRLHVLGDFYSVEYVDLWARLLDQVPALHVFGFSARWRYESDPIAKALVDLVLKRWDRFAIRFSNAPVDECSTVSIEHPLQAPSDAIVCPQQLGKTQACATCALCWQSKRRIAFIQH